jgi:predicted glutamine amidotransferase
MCIAIFKPSSATIPEEVLARCWANNPDGAGYAFFNGSGITTVKGMLTFKEFLASYNKDKANNQNFLIHFRIRSMGDKRKEDTHPFIFQHGVLIHNGTITGTGATFGKGKCDTELFTEELGEHLTKEWVQENKPKLEEVLGYNKIALMYNDGEVVIINERSGVKSDGVWYSNRSFEYNLRY